MYLMASKDVPVGYLIGTLFLVLFVTREATGAEEICGNIDIRNSAESFTILQNCTIIEGDLHILLIEREPPGVLNSLSFPKLREITGFFVLYRVSHLLTLRNMFPNLAVIRGDTLFFNYALVVYEMLEMQEIGLPSLVTVMRGSIRLEKNPSLCYMDTVDWSLILQEGIENNFIVDNKDQGGCFNFCPKKDNGRTCRRQSTLGMRELCWSSEHCQKVCPSRCQSACDESLTCCHESCIGGCDGPTDRDCIACRNLILNGRCIDRCPENTFVYQNRRCIQADKCPPKWKLHKGHCIMECPTSYITNITNSRFCQQCEGPCPKVCGYGTSIVNAVGHSETLAGCTVINGSLEIGIRSGTNIMKDLEKNLGMIEEVTEKIVIRMAHSLVSLNFFKRLKRIGGRDLENGLYSFYLLDNRNLQELFDSRSYPNITIGNGSLFFHNNPKLCVSLIRDFQEKVNFLTPPLKNNFGTNGDQVACNAQVITVVALPNSSTLTLAWKINIDLIKDKRNLLGFIVSYRKAPHKNVTALDGEDACGTSMWQSVLEKAEDRVAIVVGLEPWTQYAIFVRAYMISSAEQGAQSEITYITTKEDEPGPPSDLRVRANSSSQLMISWQLPQKPNSNITAYKVRWIKQELALNQFRMRDFCREKPPMLQTEFIPEPDEEDFDMNKTCKEGCCACPKDKETLKREEEEARFQKEFENFLHNNVFHQRIYFKFNESNTRPGSRKRRRRDVSDTPRVTLPSLTTPPTAGLGNDSTPNLKAPMGTSPAPTPLLPKETYVLDTSVVLNDLEHFSEYMIEVRACNSEHCGLQMATFGRTLANPEADEIPSPVTANSTSKNPKDRSVKLTWEEPKNPNGIVIVHEVEYSKVDNTPKQGSNSIEGISSRDANGETISNEVEKKIVVKDTCLTEHQFLQDRGYELKALDPGNYTARVRVISLAGEGPWTEPVLFNVPEPLKEKLDDKESGLSAMGATIGVCFAVVIILVFFIWLLVRWRYKKNQMPDGVLYASVNPEYMSTSDMYVADEWEFPRNQLDIICELGKGSFGMVYEGHAKKIIPEEDVSTVAVKSVQANASIRDRIEFLNEASVMKAIHTHHVVRLLGVVSKGQPTYVIMEYMAQGDLKNWLRARRPENQADVALHNRKYPPTLADIINMGAEVADGMAYLTAHKFVHRDLSARNCLVSEEGTCKVADFGLARDIYQSDYYRKEKGGMLPIRWMAPESIRDGVFTASSDVWSFGVLMWEIATLSELPYQGMSNEEAGEYVKNGNVLNKPDGCPDKLDEIMVMCWQFNEKLRPTFLEIIQFVEDTNMVSSKFAINSFYHSDERLQATHDKMNAAEMERVSILGDEKDAYENMAPKERKRTPKNGLVPVNGRAVHNGSSDSSIGKVTEC